MKFKLVENINHPTFLFHGTRHLLDILKSNTLKVGRTYSDGAAVCLTRDFQFAKRFPYILVLNRDLLSMNYKIKLKSDSKNMQNKYARNGLTQSKAEEVILQDITNLDKYIEYIVTDINIPNITTISKEKFIKEIL